MNWELTREQLLHDVSAPVTRTPVHEPIDTFDRDVCARIDTTGPGWGGASAATPDPIAAAPTPVVPVEVLKESNPRSASASGEFVIGGEARERRTTLVYGETEDETGSSSGVGAAYAIGPGPSAVEITVQGSGVGASMPTSAPVVLDDDGPDEIAGDGPTQAQPLSLDDIAAPPAFGTQAPTTDGSFAEPKLEGELVHVATQPPGPEAAPETPAAVEPGAPMTIAESADAPVPVGEVPTEAVPQMMPDPVPEAIPDPAAPVVSAAMAVAPQPDETQFAADTASPGVAPITAEAANSQAVPAEQGSSPVEDVHAEPEPRSADDSHLELDPEAAETSEPAAALETKIDSDDASGAAELPADREPAAQVGEGDDGVAEASAGDSSPSLFIPLSLMRPAVAEVDEPPLDGVAALAQEPTGEPEPVAASDSGAEELEEVEEFEEVQEVQEVDGEAATGAESEASAPPSKPPAPPEARRKRAWYDDVFGEHFQEIAPPRSFDAAERDAEFLEAVLDLPPGGSVLDVGCGGGRHAIALGKRGFEVTGIDSALSQLLAAGQNLETVDGPVSVSFMHGDMRSLPADRDFDAIVCLGTTFGYFEEEQNRQCAEGMRNRLREGGRLVLQVFNRDFLAHHLPCRSWWQGKRCMVLDEAEMNFFANRLRVHRTVIFEDGRQFEHYMFIRAFTVHDLGKMLSAIGLKVLEVSGSRETRGRFYGADSPEIWIVAERKPD